MVTEGHALKHLYEMQRAASTIVSERYALKHLCVDGPVSKGERLRCLVDFLIRVARLSRFPNGSGGKKRDGDAVGEKINKDKVI